MKINKQINELVAILLSSIVSKKYPNVLLGEKVVEEEGFYCDFLTQEVISEKDLIILEKEINRLINGGFYLEKANVNKFETQKFKQEILKDLPSSSRHFYKLVNPANKQVIYEDFSPIALDSKMKVQGIRLLSIGGSYWKSDSKNVQFTRIRGVAFETRNELEEFMQIIEERRNSDHRIIGKKLELFSFDILTGQGFPNWLENGTILKNSIQDYIKRTEKSYGFREVSTSIIGDKQLYITSGHLAHYKDDMFPAIKVHGEELILRPMTCPHHIVLYKAKPRSYLEFPIRYSEQSRLYRYEKSGALSGLERVRSMELTEGHVFVRKDQIQSEFKHCFKLIQEVLERFNIKISNLSLSLRDPKDKEKYFNDDKMWNEAEHDLRQALDSLNVKYIEQKGEAAFYGPKVDIQVLTSMQKEITVSTLQLDFLLPSRFKISYIDKDNALQTPILLHRGLIGTYERFIAILLEQTKGNLPFWLSPRQIVVIPIDNSIHGEYATDVYNNLLAMDYRVELDATNNRLNKKIRDAQTSKIKYQIIVGDDEIKSKSISIREYGSEETKTIKLDKAQEFFQKIQ